MCRYVNVIIDDKPVRGVFGYTIMQTCLQEGIDLPRFCYHDKLLIAGNCRICLVEVVGSKKLVVACSVPIVEGMVVHTNTIRVRLARQNVIEFLLANHPLDCPICDQGGECDLQDITSIFGADRGRFYEYKKRAVLNKEFGPLIRTSMNRCIHCTRCVRFMALSSGSTVIGTLGRGFLTEIGTYVGKFLSDELSGNITDLCPVGALTSKPYSFKARPWELVSVESLDIFDSLNSNTFIDVTANNIVRVLPRSNDSLNECWLTNKARYAYDSLYVQRLESSFLKIKFSFFYNKNNPLAYEVETFLKISSSVSSLVLFNKFLDTNNVDFFVYLGDTLDTESTFAVKNFFNLLGNSNFFYTFESPNSLALDFNFLYLFNVSLLELASLPSFCLLVGTNLRFESPLINFRLARAYYDSNLEVYKIGSSFGFSSYKIKHISSNLLDFLRIAEFKHTFCKNLYYPIFSYQPYILFGQSLTSRFDFNIFMRAADIFVNNLQRFTPAASVNTFVSAFKVLPTVGLISLYSSRLHYADLGLTSSNLKFFSSFSASSIVGGSNVVKNISILYSIGFDFYNISTTILSKTVSSPLWLVYQGSHGGGLSNFANLILPTTTYVERLSFYRNMLGNLQKSYLVIQHNTAIKTDKELFRYLINTSYKFFLTKLFVFNFTNGLQFNLQFALTSELLLNSTFFFLNSSYVERVLFLRAKASGLQHSASSIFKNFSYLVMYSNFFVGLTRKSLSLNMRSRTDNALLVFFPSTLAFDFSSSLLVNYYGDHSSILVRVSRTMNLCSSLYLKKNFSFSKSYF